jgi:aminodeoxyfutalosine deaminase
MNPPLRRILIHAAAITDGNGVYASPGAVLVEAGHALRIVAVGRPEEIGQVEAAHLVSRPEAVVVPALVNVHAHLDLTHIGPADFDGDFTRWVDGVRAGRARSPAEIAASVREGVRLSRAGGTAIIGDIAGVRSTVPTLTLREEGLGGVSFLEVFGVGQTQQAAIEVMAAAVESVPALDRGVKFGLQPHAPYSCGPEVYRAAARLAASRTMKLPLATHLAETPEELEFVANAGGPLAEMLRRLGVWDDSVTGFGVHSIEHVVALWRAGKARLPFIAAHLNYIDDQHLEMLASVGGDVAYCPRASAYFGHASHRYRDMLAAGINVALGTDSILCLNTPDRISVLDDMRLLHQRDGTDALTLLRMATVNGARALGVRESLATLSPGESAGLLAIKIDAKDGRDLLTQVLRNNEAPEWLAEPVRGRDDWFA